MPHNLPAEFQLKKILETEIGKLYFYEDILVLEAKEGITLSYDTGFSVLLKSLNILDEKPWVYIGNRVNSYATQPVDLKYLNELPSLKAVGTVNYSELGVLNSELESKFCTKPFEIFNNLEEAMIWAKTQL